MSQNRRLSDVGTDWSRTSANGSLERQKTQLSPSYSTAGFTLDSGEMKSLKLRLDGLIWMQDFFIFKMMQDQGLY